MRLIDSLSDRGVRARTTRCARRHDAALIASAALLALLTAGCELPRSLSSWTESELRVVVDSIVPEPMTGGDGDGDGDDRVFVGTGVHLALDAWPGGGLGPPGQLPCPKLPDDVDMEVAGIPAEAEVNHVLSPGHAFVNARTGYQTFCVAPEGSVRVTEDAYASLDTLEVFLTDGDDRFGLTREDVVQPHPRVVPPAVAAGGTFLLSYDGARGLIDAEAEAEETTFFLDNEGGAGSIQAYPSLTPLVNGRMWDAAANGPEITVSVPAETEPGVYSLETETFGGVMEWEATTCDFARCRIAVEVRTARVEVTVLATESAAAP